MFFDLGVFVFMLIKLTEKLLEEDENELENIE